MCSGLPERPRGWRRLTYCHQLRPAETELVVCKATTIERFLEQDVWDHVLKFIDNMPRETQGQRARQERVLCSPSCKRPLTKDFDNQSYMNGSLFTCLYTYGTRINCSHCQNFRGGSVIWRNQSSDWAFIVKTGASVDYAVRR